MNTAQPQPVPTGPRMFPASFGLHYNDGGILGDGIKFTLGTSAKEPIYLADLSKDKLTRPKLSLLPINAPKNTPPLAIVKSKGLKDSVITLPPPPGSSYKEVEQRMKTHFGLESRTYEFEAPVLPNGQLEQFAWRRAKGGAGAGSSSACDMGMSTESKRELVRGEEVVAVWTDDDGMSGSMTNTGAFEFVGRGASGAFGPQWEIMAVVSVLRIWHEDYYVAKKVADALGGGA